tara:strand:+ start:3954 stop:4547 length:594 start_codon:yes stop_codon:yes gene_type:complete
MKELVLIGCGGHSKSIIDLIESSKLFKIYGLIGLTSELGKKILGHEVIGTDNDLQTIRNSCSYAFIAIGQIKSSLKRRELQKKLINLNFKFPKIISPNSYISTSSSFGEGTSIGHGAIINAEVKIGKHCIINSNALLEHDVKVGNYSHISTGVILNGNVEIGEESFIGSGAIIREGLKIPSGSIISAGERVMFWPTS